MRHESGDPVVVAVSKFVVGDRIIFVDDWHTTEFQQPTERLAGVQVLGPIDEVMRVEQHLSADQTECGKLLVVLLHDPALAHR